MNPSLLLIPDRYKAAKLYSQIPDSGAGDLTFARASVATRVNASGLIESVASGVPRLDYTGGGCPSLLLEPQRTNLALFSEQFDNAAWTKVRSTITANNTTSPAGYLDADLLVADTSTNDHFILRSATASISQTFSIFAKASGYNFVFVGSDNVNDRGVFFNLTNGTISQNTSTLTAKIEDYGNGWYRCAVSSASWPQAFALVATSANGTALVHTGNGTSGVFTWGAQLEGGSYATSYIPTLGSSVTRLAEVASKDSLSVFGTNLGSFFVDVTGPNFSGVGYVFDLSDNINAGSNRFALLSAGINSFNFFNGASNLFSFDTASRKKILVVWNGTNVKLYINGAVIQNLTISNTNPTSINLNSRFNEADFGSNQFFTVAAYQTALSDSEAIQLTTL